MKTFTSWQDIKDWANEHGYKLLAKRLQLNNDCWASCGEFGRNQKYLCDALRFCESETERKDTAERLERELKGDEVLALV